MPPEVGNALFYLAMAERFHVLPSQVKAEDVSLLRYLAIEREIQGA